MKELGMNFSFGGIDYNLDIIINRNKLDCIIIDYNLDNFVIEMNGSVDRICIGDVLIFRFLDPTNYHEYTRYLITNVGYKLNLVILKLETTPSFIDISNITCPIYLSNLVNKRDFKFNNLLG